MRNFYVSFLILLFSTLAHAKHLSLNVTNKGVQNLLTSALNTYSKDKNLKTIEIPGNTIYDKIEKEFFDTNPVVAKIKEFVNFKQEEDLVFYFKWSPIYIDAKMQPGSLKVNVNGEQKHFQAAIKLSLNKLKIFGKSLELCELKKWKCDKQNALYGKFSDYIVSLKNGSTIDIAAILDVKVTSNNVELKLTNFLSNLVKPKTSKEKALYQKYGISITETAKLDIAFSKFTIPAPQITINGETFTLDVSKLKDAILSEKAFLTSELAKFAGGFLATDLTKILNEDFFSKLKDLKTTVNVFEYDNYVSQIDLENDPRYLPNYTYAAVADNTRVAIPPQVHYIRQNYSATVAEPTFMEQLSSVIKSVIHQAKFDMTYLQTQTIDDKDVKVNFSSTLELNKKVWSVGTKLRNGKATLQNPNFSSINSKTYDAAIALSEPMINAAFNMAIDTGVIQRVMDDLLELKGTYAKGVHFHFEEGYEKTYKTEVIDPKRFAYVAPVDNTYVHINKFKPYKEFDREKKTYRIVKYRTADSIVAVIELVVNLKEQDSNGIGGWISNQIGSLLEGGKIWFPLEIKLIPQIVEEQGKTYLELYAEAPFAYKGLKNSYGYPYKDMYGIVENGLIDKLKKDLTPLFKDIPRVDLTPYLKVQGMEFQPVNLHVKKTGHLIITTNITKLNLKELSESKVSK